MQLITGNLWSDLTDHLPNYFVLLLSQMHADRRHVRLTLPKILAMLKRKLKISVIVIMSTLAMIILIAKLRSVTIVALLRSTEKNNNQTTAKFYLYIHRYTDKSSSSAEISDRVELQWIQFG